MQYYFTFGYGHYNGDGKHLYGCYTTISAMTEDDARARMNERRKTRWSKSYATPESAGVYKYNLRYIPFNHITAQPEVATNG